jgi:hypothetical protein
MQWLETGAAGFWFFELLESFIILKDNLLAFIADGFNFDEFIGLCEEFWFWVIG